MPTAIDPAQIGTTATGTQKKATGPQSLTSSDFMNLMLKQLQNQDPMNPTDSNALLQQISQISSLQSNQSLQTSLTQMTLQQTVGSAGNLIGKAVQGINEAGVNTAGAVRAVRVQDKQVYLQLDNGSVLPMSNIVAIAPASAMAANGVTNGAATGVPNAEALNGLASALAALGLR